MNKKSTQGIKYSITNMSSTQKTQSFNAKKRSNDLKKVVAITVETDLRKTCEMITKHRKHIWAIFEGCPSKRHIFSGFLFLST
jgi:hypothetical protein